MIDWSWIPANADRLGPAILQHLVLALVPVLIGLVVAVPVGWLANRSRAARAVLVPAAGLLYTIPSLVLFIVLPGILGTQILDPLNVVVALSVYTVALLVRSVADALAAVPGMVVAAATAMGYKPARRFAQVELPLSLPVLISGLRVATVTNISLVAVGALIGIGGLGYFLTDGFLRGSSTSILVGTVLIFVIALIFDSLLVLVGKLATPWVGAGASR
ncbi:ABC transporter permease [Pseudonocardia broussonetiae]|uniref:ABC transporter permease subunit n=1 Tax=Pseudonocardia broussonetiae TaxID=2736640 RepID=A0A6M6JFJ1_9PSEU|nr:ABC transporter permease subunit [Pseudonocardia broussonetiae]QJY46768.1 ABC transporter permease subunit [Pseudonocardia broussonetiae]